MSIHWAASKLTKTPEFELEPDEAHQLVDATADAFPKTEIPEWAAPFVRVGTLANVYIGVYAPRLAARGMRVAMERDERKKAAQAKARGPETPFHAQPGGGGANPPPATPPADVVSRETGLPNGAVGREANASLGLADLAPGGLDTSGRDPTVVDMSYVQ